MSQPARKPKPRLVPAAAPSELTLGDLELLESEAGLSFTEIVAQLHGEDVMPPIKVLLALAFVVRHREDPDFTKDDARAVPLSEMLEISAEFAALIPDTPDPTGAAS